MNLKGARKERPDDSPGEREGNLLGVDEKKREAAQKKMGMKEEIEGKTRSPGAAVVVVVVDDENIVVTGVSSSLSSSSPSNAICSSPAVTQASDSAAAAAAAVSAARENDGTALGEHGEEEEEEEEEGVAGKSKRSVASASLVFSDAADATFSGSTTITPDAGEDEETRRLADRRTMCERGHAEEGDDDDAGSTRHREMADRSTLGKEMNNGFQGLSHPFEGPFPLFLSACPLLGIS